MKFKALILLLLINSGFTNNTIINDLIVLPKENKISGTFSGDISDTDSFHLIFSKNKKSKKFETFTYLVTKNGVEKLAIFSNKKEYSVVSFHKKGAIISLLLSYDIKKNSFINRVDINLKTKIITTSKPYDHNDFITSIREVERTILLYKTKKELTIKQFISSGNPKVSLLKFKKKNDVNKSFFDDSSLESIKTDEFVSNGSTNKLRVYASKNELIFTKENESKSSTSVLRAFINKEKLNPKIHTFNNKGSDKFKKMTSYFLNGNLYQLGLNKNEGIIKISNLSSKKEVNKISFNKSLLAKITGNKELVKFLKQAKKNKFNPTITVNKTKKKNVKVRVDYVDVSYSYNNNWWYLHQHMMMHNQFMMQNSMPSGFGPSIDDQNFSTYLKTTKNHYFEFILDNNGLFTKTEKIDSETLYKEIDKKKYIEELEETKGIKFESSCFLKNSFRYIFYNKSMKGFVIKTDKLK